MRGAVVTQINSGADTSDPYRLDVIAPGIVDAVSLIGGWVFDRAMAGWQVTFVLPDADLSAELSARVLGAEVADYGASDARTDPAHTASPSSARHFTTMVFRASSSKRVVSGAIEVSLVAR